MKKIFLLLMVFIIPVLLLTGCVQKTKTKESVTYEPVAKPAEEKVTAKATLVIDDGTGHPQSFELTVSSEMTAYDLLKAAAKQAGLSLKTKKYDFGISIEGIGDMIAGKDGKYWMYYVDGKLAPVACDKQKISPGARVEFKFEKSEM